MAPRNKQDPDKADEGTQAQPVVGEAPAKSKLNTRITGAYQLGGVWYAADGSVLTNAETQLAHRAKDKADVEARRKAILGQGGAA